MQLFRQSLTARNGDFQKLGVPLMGVVGDQALGARVSENWGGSCSGFRGRLYYFGLYTRAPLFWKLPKPFGASGSRV